MGGTSRRFLSRREHVRHRYHVSQLPIMSLPRYKHHSVKGKGNWRGEIPSAGIGSMLAGCLTGTTSNRSRSASVKYRLHRFFTLAVCHKMVKPHGRPHCSALIIFTHPTVPGATLPIWRNTRKAAPIRICSRPIMVYPMDTLQSQGTSRDISQGGDSAEKTSC